MHAPKCTTRRRSRRARSAPDQPVQRRHRRSLHGRSRGAGRPQVTRRVRGRNSQCGTRVHPNAGRSPRLPAGWLNAYSADQTASTTSGSNARMMSDTSTVSSVDGQHPARKPGHHDGRWMVTPSRALSTRPLKPSTSSGECPSVASSYRSFAVVITFAAASAHVSNSGTNQGRSSGQIVPFERTTL
jgi:hypothetical protein